MAVALVLLVKEIAMRKPKLKSRKSRILILCTLLGALGVSTMSGCIVVDRHHDHWHRW
jgi:hypothetical protein